MAMTYNNKTRRRPHIAQADSERRLVFLSFCETLYTVSCFLFLFIFH